MASSSRHTASTIAGRVLLAALLVWAVGSLYISASFLWTTRGTTGLTSDYGGDITGVAPGSPAAEAGISAGDRILLPQTPYESRPELIGNAIPIAPGTVVRFRLERDGSARDVTLRAVPYDLGIAGRISLFLSSMSAAIFIIVGAALILLRPSVVTWGFGLYGLLSNPVVPALSRFPSYSAHLTYVTLYDILQNVGVVGLLVFALNFPKPLQRPWRLVLARALPAIFIVLAGWTLFIDLAVCVFAIPVRTQNFALQIAFGIVDLLAVVLITETYEKGPSENRPRLRWVLIGFYVGLLCNYVGNLLVYTSNVSLPGWLDATLIASEVTLPLTVSYAIVRHRVIDVDLFISRALVYAIFTTCLVVIFGFTDWAFSRLISDFRLSLVLDAGISVGLAFAFDNAQKILEHGIARFIFRGRQQAWDRLERVAKTFRFVTDPASIDHALVDEPHEALQLSAVALFRRSGNAYRRVASVGWSDGDCTVLAQDDRLVLEHLAQDGPRYLSEIPWHREDLPPRFATPVVSIALQSANELTGLILFSRRRNGEDIDPDELRKLTEFANAAAVAYDRLNAEELRKKAAELELQVSVLKARLDESRHDKDSEASLA